MQRHDVILKEIENISMHQSIDSNENKYGYVCFKKDCVFLPKSIDHEHNYCSNKSLQSQSFFALRAI